MTTENAMYSIDTETVMKLKTAVHAINELGKHHDFEWYIVFKYKNPHTGNLEFRAARSIELMFKGNAARGVNPDWWVFAETITHGRVWFPLSLTSDFELQRATIVYNDKLDSRQVTSGD